MSNETKETKNDEITDPAKIKEQQKLQEEQIRIFQKSQMDFWKANTPYLKANVNFEKLKAELEKARFEQTYYKMKYAEMAAPPTAEQLEEAAKKRKEAENK